MWVIWEETTKAKSSPVLVNNVPEPASTPTTVTNAQIWETIKELQTEVARLRQMNHAKIMEFEDTVNALRSDVQQFVKKSAGKQADVCRCEVWQKLINI